MRILVTGGAGFIASHIVDAYLEQGHDVAVVDNLSTGKLDNLNPKAEFLELSVQDPNLSSFFKSFKPDVINHHAAHINLRKSVDDPLYDADANIMGSLNLLKLSREFSVKKLIFSSTGGAIYGETETLPVNEKQETLPLSPYGVGKLSVEHYIRIWNHLFGLNYTIFRYPNIYGPRQDPNGEAGVVAIFSLKILKGETPVIFGDGTKTRDYLFVADVVRANVLALNSGNNVTLNLGWGVEISDRKVFDTVKDSLNYHCEPEYVDVRPGEVKRISLDSKMARDVLTWKPEVDFTHGVKRAVQFYSEEKQKY